MSFVAYQEGGLTLNIKPERTGIPSMCFSVEAVGSFDHPFTHSPKFTPTTDVVKLTMEAVNSSPSNMDSFAIQVAVPKVGFVQSILVVGWLTAHPDSQSPDRTLQLHCSRPQAPASVPSTMAPSHRSHRSPFPIRYELERSKSIFLANNSSHTLFQTAQVRLLLRINYVQNGQSIVKQHQVGQLPPF